MESGKRDNRTQKGGSSQKDAPGPSSSLQIPTLTLPKGGGAIRGIGEKFAANPVTGSGSMSVPIYTSPGRSGFGPQLSLAYDSGAGNGSFGFGWSLSLPAITRKTDKGLPQYQDAEESDVFILSGTEDLVPVLVEVAEVSRAQTSKWERVEQMRQVHGATYRIQRYCPRVEGLFARLERWTNEIDRRDTFWRSISKDNITTWYGKSKESRIADPSDASRIFSWLICESYDDKGNVIAYTYKSENSDGVPLSDVHERNRSDVSRSANRYLKRITYGNGTPHFPDLTAIEVAPLPASWLFEVVFDYGEHDDNAPVPNEDTRTWDCRDDPFSAYRAGFEVRTYRLCRRVLMFHHFPKEQDVGADCLVRSTDFVHSQQKDQADPRGAFFSFLLATSTSGYKRRAGGGYLTKSMPPLEFEYTQPTIDETVQEVDDDSIDNLPCGLDGMRYQWVDLDGEGLSGILTEQAGSWFYKRNLSPINLQSEKDRGTVAARFGPIELVARQPSLAALGAGGQQLLDLAGDGQLDLVQFGGPTPGFYERTKQEDWEPFRSFRSLPVLDWRNPNLKFVDLTGDGHADLCVSEDEVFCWYPSLAEAGFSCSQRVCKCLEEEEGPRLLFEDGTHSIFLADLSGDGLTDLVRIRNGEVCYWPNLGYGRFGRKVTMDQAPWFETPDVFDARRIRLADIDGSGTTDIIYLASQGVQLYFNHSGNRWGEKRTLSSFPQVDNLSSVTALDMLGNGTACLSWASSLPSGGRTPMRYIDLMGQKPHLLVKSIDNLGAETHVQFAPSTKFYVADKLAGTPWITKLPFPVHVVERVETIDHISRNRFVTAYTYHHGFFDGIEREFRGFGMVEQLDTDEFAALRASDPLPDAFNIDEASYVPPVRTKTWFHTGAYLDRDHISDFFAGLLDDQDEGEYYREPGLTDAQARQLLLDDTELPAGLTVEEEREACRALKGAMLRQEVYALDGADNAQHPYSVTEQNVTIRCVQPQAGQRHGVFFTHANESINYHYERIPTDPRITHALTLEVDPFGNVLKAAAVGYGRRQPDTMLSVEDSAKQMQTLITYTESTVTDDDIETNPDDYRTPLPCDTRTYELTGSTPAVGYNRFTAEQILTVGTGGAPIAYEQTPRAGVPQRRLIERGCALYRPSDLGVAQGDPQALLPLGKKGRLALPGEAYKLAFTPGLLADVYGGRVGDAMLESEGRYVHFEGDENWWIHSGRIFYSTAAGDSPAQELTYARQHFFLPHRYRDPFHTDAVSTETFVGHDDYDLLIVETRDALGNRITVGERDAAGATTGPGNDYRLLQPQRVTDANRNRTAVAFDALGVVVGTAVMGKAGPAPVEGDSLDGFDADLTDVVVLDHIANPLADPQAILGRATTRLVYDLFAYYRTKDQSLRNPAIIYAIARETHDSDPVPQGGLKIQHSFSYSDGWGRDIEKKIQAEPGRAPARDVNGVLKREVNNRPVFEPTSSRWVGTGRTVVDNKGNPVKKYEPFFSSTPAYEDERDLVESGVTPILHYDPLSRLIRTDDPNGTFSKIEFDPWRQATWDANDTVLQSRWFADRQALPSANPERQAATLAAGHAGTPAIGHLDTLGRTFLTIADNGAAGKYATRVGLDIEGNQRSVTDARGRKVMTYDYDMLGHRVHQVSMDAGERWMLSNVAGNAIRTWDSRDHQIQQEYDQLRRPVRLLVQTGTGMPAIAEQTVYGDSSNSGLAPAQAQAANLLGKPYQHYDGAGLVTTESYDFKGNLRISSRQLLENYVDPVDWSLAPSPVLETETFTGSTTYDALNRPTTLTAPDRSVVRPLYNEANLLEGLSVNPRGATAATAFVTNIDYNAKGQRELIEYGNGTRADNGVRTDYVYDPETFHLTNLKTTRRTDNAVLQDLSYTYDPVGNITDIRDDAQAPVFYNNAVISPGTQYEYDAMYRLIQAAGREHAGQTANNRPEDRPDYKPHYDFNDSTRMNMPHPNDGQAMRRYTEEYRYDEVGNFLSLIHRASGANWTRRYAYDTGNSVPRNNRLHSTSLPGDREAGPYLATFDYDAHGNMIRMPHLMQMQWDYKDRLQMVDLEGGGKGYYVYDSAGRRVRKVWEKSTSLVEERIYVGCYELFRRRRSGRVALERETLHITDAKCRIAQLETKTVDADASRVLPSTLTRYQFPNHLGSASLELDNLGAVISYEEYYPYGSTSYHALRSQTETSRSYRYIGKERDEESGLYYHVARYYAPWLGRWTSCDPAGLVDGSNLYKYGRDNPVRFTDATGLGSDDPVPDLTEFASSDRGSTGVRGSHGSLASLVKKPIEPALAPQPKVSQSAAPRATPPAPKMSDAESLTNLKAVMERLQPTYTYPPAVTRVMGGLQLGGALLEGAGALYAEPETAGLSTVVLLNAADTGFTGLRMMATGESVPSFKYQLSSSLAAGFGADPKLASAIGVLGDISGNAAAAGASMNVAARPVKLTSPKFSMSEGLYRSSTPLATDEVEAVTDYAASLGMPRDQITYSPHQSTSYWPTFDQLVIGPDVNPAAAEGLLNPANPANSRVSPRGAIAHEVQGHRAAAQANMTHSMDSAEEAQASFRAALKAPGLTDAERWILTLDAIARLRGQTGSTFVWTY